MYEAKTLYIIRAGGDKPIELLEYPIVGEDKANYYITLLPENSQKKTIAKDSLMVRPKETLNATMMGLDKDALIRLWNGDVKKSALRQLRPYLGILVQEKKKEPVAFAQVKEKPKVQKQDHHGSIKQVEQPVSERDDQNDCTPYPRACAVSWASVDALLVIWVINHFAVDSSAFARPLHGTYADGQEGWSIILENLAPSDRDTVAGILAQHDLGYEINLDKEWPNNDTPAGQALSLTTSISDHIMGNEILPSQNPAFVDGVARSIATPADIVFIADGIAL